MLSSARMSYELAYKNLQCLIEAGYQDMETLKKATWQERAEVLTRKGHTRYGETTATAFGKLADFIEKEYGLLHLQAGSLPQSLPLTSFKSTDNDLRNLLKKADSCPTTARQLLQEVRGIGKVSTGIFFDAARGIWPFLAPFTDPESMETAKHCGRCSDVDVMCGPVGKDPVQMCKLSSAPTMVRLK